MTDTFKKAALYIAALAVVLAAALVILPAAASAEDISGSVVIQQGETVTYSSADEAITVSGSLTNNGIVFNYNTISNSGTIENNGILVNYGTIDSSSGTFTNNGSVVNIGGGSVTGTVTGTQPDTVGTALKITGENLTYGVDYTYPASTGVLTVLSGKEVEIANVNSEVTTDHIEVADAVSANITLAGVNITSNTAGILIADNSTGNVRITLADNTANTLKAQYSHAGIEKNGLNGTLLVTCEHSGEQGHLCDEHCGSLYTKGDNEGKAIGSKKIY